MDSDEVAGGWYWSHRHGEGGGHGEYLSTCRMAVLIDNDDLGFGVGLATPETVC